MSVRESYNRWAKQYDTNINKTRDLEGIVLRAVLDEVPFKRCLEIGCGTGKNTTWLITKADHVTAVDLSEEMLTKAKEKISSDRVQFTRADITEQWNFAGNGYDLVTFSLVLEHIADLVPVFKKVSDVLNPGGFVYIGELHPFKQYGGSKARFETDKGEEVVTCYTHHVSDFVEAALQNDLSVIDVKEFFDDDDRTTTPRILNLLLRTK